MHGEYQVCDQFSVLASRENQDISRCDVCDQGQSAHSTPGRRVVSGGEMESLRKQMLIAIHERREAANPSQPSGNGTAHVNNVTRPESAE
jgi:hypothetical protein